jgi:hypothetical protein
MQLPVFDTRPPLKDKDRYNTKIHLYRKGDDIWAFLESLGTFFRHNKTQQEDKYTICFDRMDSLSRQLFNSTDPDSNNPNQDYDTLVRQLCSQFGPRDPNSAFTDRLSHSKQGRQTALDYCISLYGTWKAYLLFLTNQNRMIGMTLPHDTQFIQFFLAGLNEAERLNIEDANANEPFDTYAKLLDYLTRRKTIWITLQTRYETQLQEQRNLNVHQSRLNNHQSLTEPNNTTLGQHNQQTDVQKIADAVTTSMTNFTKKIEQSLTAMSTAIMNVSERKQQTYDYADRIQPERVSNLNNHRVEHHQHYSNPYSYERMGSRANSRWSNHHSSEHTRYLNYNGSSSSSLRSRSPCIYVYNNNNDDYNVR